MNFSGTFNLCNTGLVHSLSPISDILIFFPSLIFNCYSTIRTRRYRTVLRQYTGNLIFFSSNYHRSLGRRHRRRSRVAFSVIAFRRRSPLDPSISVVLSQSVPGNTTSRISRVLKRSRGLQKAVRRGKPVRKMSRPCHPTLRRSRRKIVYRPRARRDLPHKDGELKR